MGATGHEEGLGESRLRNWRRDKEAAKETLDDIAEHAGDGIEHIRISLGICDRFEMGTKMFSTEPVTLTCPKATFPSQWSKWFKRPLGPEGQAEVAGAVAEALRMVSDEDAPDAPSSLASALDGKIQIDVLYDDGTEAAFESHEGHPSVASWLRERFATIQMFVMPSDRGTDEALSHLSSLTYANGAFLGEPGPIFTIERDKADGSCILTHEERRLDPSSPTGMSSDAYEHVMSVSEWDEFLDAVRLADIPNWADRYEDAGVYDGEWYRMSLEFDDGWELDISGKNDWDERFAPIMGFIRKYDSGATNSRQA